MKVITEAPEFRSAVRYYTPMLFDPADTGVAIGDIGLGNQILLWSFRRWAMSRKQGCPLEPLMGMYGLPGIPEATEIVEEMMTLLERCSLRPIRTQLVRAATVGSDELLLLTVVRAVQQNNLTLAKRLIARVLPGALNAVFVRCVCALTSCLDLCDLELTRISYLYVVYCDDRRSKEG